MSDGAYLDRLPHRRLAAGSAVAGLVLSYLVARTRPVPGWELDATGAINRLPEWLAAVSYPVMQLGTIGGAAVIAVAVAAFRRNLRLAAGIVVFSVIGWFVAKGLKRLVGRGRPDEYLPDIDVREGTGTGLGYVSGHSTVAAVAVVMAAAAVPPRWRPLGIGVVAVVGLARIVHGVHLPADLVGGWSLGTLLALCGLWTLDRLGAPRAATPRPT